jgi:hypothetical protein
VLTKFGTRRPDQLIPTRQNRQRDLSTEGVTDVPVCRTERAAQNDTYRGARLPTRTMLLCLSRGLLPGFDAKHAALTNGTSPTA